MSRRSTHPMRSPIEVQLRNSMCEAARALSVGIMDYTLLHGSKLLAGPEIGCVVEADDDAGEPETWFVTPDDADAAWCLYSAVSFESYRIDFVLVTYWGGVLAIECDGHDWHDRTKQQAAYDRARDRHLLLNGVPTVRFTGSEIVHSADRCAAEVYAIARRLDRHQADYVDAYSARSVLHRQDAPRAPRGDL